MLLIALVNRSFAHTVCRVFEPFSPSWKYPIGLTCRSFVGNYNRLKSERFRIGYKSRSGILGVRATFNANFYRFGSVGTMVQACLESSLAIVIGVEISLYTKSRSGTRDVKPSWLADETAGPLARSILGSPRSININKIPKTGQQRYRDDRETRQFDLPSFFIPPFVGSVSLVAS